MQFETTLGPTYALVVCRLEQGEQVMAESGAMVSGDSHLDMKTSVSAGRGARGILRGLSRKILMGETFFRNTFTAQQAAGEVTFAPALPGDIAVLEMTGGELIAQQTSYLASAPGVDIEAKWAGFKKFFGERRLFWIKASGAGPLAITAFGAIRELEIDGSFIVDTGHIVAFEPTLDYRVQRIGSWFSTLFSSEGLVCRFGGKGKLYIQTRNPREFGSRVGPKLPPRESA